MLSMKIQLGIERDIAQLKEEYDGVLPEDVQEAVDEQIKDIEYVCGKHQAVKEDYGPKLAKLFGIDFDEYWIDDYYGFDMCKFQDVLMKLHPDYQNYNGPEEMIKAKYPPEIWEMISIIAED
jgi:hypothetical protein